MSESSHTEGLIFSNASVSIDKTLSKISKSSLSITNRLHSIARDAAFVRHVAETLDLPVIANERCGSWYVPPNLKSGSAYFKSTDGHYGVWAFSLRRLNLQVLEIAGERGGCIVVDSTRRGKHMPDALSKAVPIWCAVINRLLFPEIQKFHEVEQFVGIVSDSELVQILEHLPTFVDSAKSLELDVKALRTKLKKPLKPLWIARSLHLYPEVIRIQDSNEEYTTLYLCMASEHHEDVSVNQENYVQGAGDDIEHWSYGLTPEIYWTHQLELLRTSEDGLQGLISTLATNEDGRLDDLITVARADWLSIGKLDEGTPEIPHDVLLVVCSPNPSCELNEQSMARMLHMQCSWGKLGSRDLRRELPKLKNFLEKRLKIGQRIQVRCPSGVDLAVGIGLAVLCLRAAEDGSLLVSSINSSSIDKPVIRRKLSWIMASAPRSNPSRATLNAVNSFLMS